MNLLPGMIFEIDGSLWEFSCNYFHEAEFINPTKPYKLSFSFKDEFSKEKVESVKGLDNYKLIFHPNQEIYNKFEQIGENPEIEEEGVETMSYFSLLRSDLEIYRDKSGSFVFCYVSGDENHEIKFDLVNSLKDLNDWVFDIIVGN